MPVYGARGLQAQWQDSAGSCFRRPQSLLNARLSLIATAAAPIVSLKTYGKVAGQKASSWEGQSQAFETLWATGSSTYQGETSMDVRNVNCNGEVFGHMRPANRFCSKQAIDETRHWQA